MVSPRTSFTISGSTSIAWRITERNCAILDVARRYGAACASELAFLRSAMPDASVERIKHKMAGDFVCAYRITARGGITR